MANEHFKRTPTSTGNNKVFTWSGWVKRNIFSANYAGSQNLFRATGGSGGDCGWRFDYTTPADSLRVFLNGAAGGNVQADGKSRDPGTWMHVMVAFNTTLEQDSARVRIYVNGALIPDNNAGYPSKNFGTSWNETVTQYISAYNGSTEFFNGQMCDVFMIDGQALTPDVFGFYKDGDGYISVGSTQATDFRPGQWMPHAPSKIKKDINRRGGFGVNGFYLPMNDSSNPGADFHCDPNSIIKLKGEDLPQPRNGAPTTSDAYVSQLRTDPFAANIVLAVPGISLSPNAELVTNGTFDTDVSGWTITVGSAPASSISWVGGSIQVTRGTGAGAGQAAYQAVTVEVGKSYVASLLCRGTVSGTTTPYLFVGTTAGANDVLSAFEGQDYQGRIAGTFTATGTTVYVAAVLNNYATVLFDNISIREVEVPIDYSADIKGSGTNKTLTANGNAGVGYEIPGYYGSAMTFDGSGDFLSIPDTDDFEFGTGDYTVEFWVNCQRAISGTIYYEEIVTKGYPLQIYRSNTGAMFLAVSQYASPGGYDFNGSFGIPGVGDWAHICIERYSGRTSMYLNGVSGNTTTASVSIYNSSSNFSIGEYADNTVYPFNGYIQDLRVYKGLAKYKGGFDVPKPYTPVGIEAFRTTADTCKNNFATWNAVDRGSLTLSDGNLSIENSGSYRATRATVGIPTTGKWYYEHRESTARKSNVIGTIGIAMNNHTLDGNAFSGSFSGFYWGSAGLQFAINGVNPGTGWVSSPGIGDGDILNIAYDADSRNIWFGINGTYYTVSGVTLNGNGNPTSGTNPTGTVSATYSNIGIFPYCNAYNTISQTNFGQNPSFSGQVTAGTNADDSGKGLFKYAPPSGFLALCEDNLPAPAIADPGDYMRTVLYTGDGNYGRSITGVGFQPDFVWTKERSSTSGHFLLDSVRGVTNYLSSHSTAAEGSSTNTIISFDSSGYSIGASGAFNESNQTYVAWCWKAGGAAVSNTDGSITSVVSVNQTAGFSIVSYTGNATDSTVGHGLNKTPGFIIVKKRNGGADWPVYHHSLATQEYLVLNSTSAKNTTTELFYQDPTSSVFYIGDASNAINASGGTYIAYCWTEIEGFSKFGSFSGNSSTDGVFVYTGHRPAFVMIKRTDSTGNWVMHDNARNSTNPAKGYLLANSSGVEEAGSDILDFLSNGFKIRNSWTDINASGGSYVFASFAESPFQTANAK